MNNSVHKPVVIVCPLDWGLGHATRCIPVIRELLSLGAEVIIAGDGSGMNLLHEEFPDLRKEMLQGYGIRFSEKLSVGNYLLLNLPRYLYRIFKEHYQIKELVSRTKADAIISDNRYGLWHKGIYTVFITHQPNIIPPKRLKFTRSLLRKITRHYIKLYNECWIPDFADHSGLSGDLSHGWPVPQNVKYIGQLSRFYSETETLQKEVQASEDYQIIAIISGPEPHRSRFEKLLVKHLTESKLKSLLIRGIPGDNESKRLIKGSLTVVNHLNSSEMYSVLKKGNTVICRGGYSTLMDLSVTGNKVICIPTPGQSEQEYLSSFLSARGYAVRCSEEDFNLPECYTKIIKTESLPFGHGMLTEAVQSMLLIITAK